MKQKIIVLEDNQKVLEDVCSILSFEGYEVSSAMDGKEALNLLEGFVPDIFICDIMMPEMDGYEFLSLVRQKSHLIDVPFIFLTAKDEKEAIRDGMLRGADDYIVKPFSGEDLLTAVRVRLQRKNEIKAKVIRELEESKKEVNLLTKYDPLSGLPNTKLLYEILETQSKENENTFFSVFYIDIDRFRYLNDILGGDKGDRLIQVFANRLVELASAQEHIFHLRGDKFLILRMGQLNLEETESIANRIIRGIRLPNRIDNYELTNTCSLGIAHSDRNYSHWRDVIENAELALLRSRQKGGNCFSFYHTRFRKQRVNTLALESDLKRAIQQDQFQVYYQPKICIPSNKICGFEALIRWQHPLAGFVSPSRFIPVAEESGLILGLGEWIFRKSCEQAVKWKKNPHLEKFRIAVNLSPQQLQGMDIVSMVKNTIVETGLEPSYLDFEITESLLMKNLDYMVAVLQTLQKMGITISLDDFGTGYSSLAYLKTLPINCLKIDRSFVRELEKSSSDRKIISSIISLGKSLGLEIIAEGVETPGQLQILMDNHCDMYQGYLYSPPMAAEKIEEKFSNSKNLTNRKALVSPVA